MNTPLSYYSHKPSNKSSWQIKLAYKTESGVNTSTEPSFLSFTTVELYLEPTGIDSRLLSSFIKLMLIDAESCISIENHNKEGE